MNASLLLLLALLAQADPVPASPPPPPSFGDTLVVTASRSEERLTDAVAPTSVLTRDDLDRSPGMTLDDQLRQIPGFSLLRRSSSLTAHPTSQGVSLRGLGPSGASRTLVLFDGVPLNDPFGGWVYWNRLPLSSLESVEVARGALSQLYGSAAMGGAIQLLPRPPRPDTLEVTARGGDRRTGDAEVFASDAAPSGNWGYSLSGRAFRTDGFYILSPENRGAVDRPATVDFGTLFGRVTWGGYHLGVNAFREERGNGTALQVNDTSLQSLQAGWAGEHWQWDAFGQTQDFRSTFSRILPDRSREFLTAKQDFETTGFGASTAWRSSGGLLAGADVRRASWDVQDQTLGGVYAQQTFDVTPRLDLLAGARLDLWASSTTRTSFNPRLGAAFRAADDLTVRASAYRGFRAPTLNELYRPFQVGNVVTLANADLREETLTGAEIGADLTPSPRLFARLNVFRNRIDGAVGNVTLAVTSQGITRQRENLDRVNADGVEAELRLRPSQLPRWELQASYLYTDSRVDRTGLRVPQVPLNQGSLGIAFAGSVAMLLQGRWAGQQFDDDLNQLPLRGYVVADLSLRRPFGNRLDVFLSAENLFDRKVVTGRSPIETLGTPRLVQVGVKVRR
ncbi:MAG TPA: TonB-dependent receptor [Thermoanaerobaculia bacterium]|jgi:outer membrane receptor protein involved in Fe transport|nr:TonB-dependent receptor [Thermoanaerobaculia bacterium]